MSPIMLSLMAAFVAIIILYLWMKYTSSSDDEAVLNKNIYISVFFITAGVVFGVLHIISNLTPDISIVGNTTSQKFETPRMDQGTVVDFSIPDSGLNMELETGIPKF